MNTAPVPTPEDEAELDRVIEKIESALPKIHQRAQVARDSTTTPPTQALDLRNLKKTQERFVNLAAEETREPLCPKRPGSTRRQAIDAKPSPAYKNGVHASLKRKIKDEDEDDKGSKSVVA